MDGFIYEISDRKLLLEEETEMTELFNKFLEVLDLYLDRVITQEKMESSFTEEEWDELYTWHMVLMELIRTYHGRIEKMVEDFQQKNPEETQNLDYFQRILHLKKILEENPSRIIRFEEMISYLEEKWHDTIGSHVTSEKEE